MEKLNWTAHNQALGSGFTGFRGLGVSGFGGLGFRASGFKVGLHRLPATELCSKKMHDKWWTVGYQSERGSKSSHREYIQSAVLTGLRAEGFQGSVG